jgi:hypothetical protein
MPSSFLKPKLKKLIVCSSWSKGYQSLIYSIFYEISKPIFYLIRDINYKIKIGYFGKSCSRNARQKIPSTKKQITNNIQIPKSNDPNESRGPSIIIPNTDVSVVCLGH